MRRKFVTGAIAILTLTAIALPTSADAKGGGGHVRRVRMLDRCDPASFDAAIGPGTCVPHSGELVTFGEFLAQLNPMDFGHEKWSFKPDEIDLKMGDSISAEVKGGEFHSFTKVDEFGPGCVQFINDALGLVGPPAGDCAKELNPVFLGGSGSAPGLPPVVVSGLAPGSYKFICLIHPWMRAIVDVRDKG
ncbi:MAG: hypothetical protein ABI706_20790 [Ilumatobacteraceae bacterium]